jgi:Pyruvate/2-oxoacid:ferredoxin oxidoreductase gamma subunit
MRLGLLSTNEGGIIVDSRDLNINVLKDIATFSEDYKIQIQEFMRANSVGETVNDFLNYAKQKNIQVFAVPYMDLLKQIGEKLHIEQVSALQKMINVLTIGISFALLKYDRKLVEDAIRATFHERRWHYRGFTRPRHQCPKRYCYVLRGLQDSNSSFHEGEWC